jgi:hypothetical protein
MHTQKSLWLQVSSILLIYFWHVSIILINFFALITYKNIEVLFLLFLKLVFEITTSFYVKNSASYLKKNAFVETINRCINKNMKFRFERYIFSLYFYFKWLKILINFYFNWCCLLFKKYVANKIPCHCF